MSGVLYISYDGLLEPLGGSQILAYVERLADRGVRMAVLSFEKPADLRDSGQVQALRERLDANGVHWHPLRYHRHPRLAATALDLALGIRNGCRLAKSYDLGLVHARSYVAARMGLAIKRSRGARLLFDMRGFWIDERIDTGGWSNDGRLTRVMRRMERQLLQGADAIVVLTHSAAEALPELTGETPLPRVRVIPTCVDLKRFAPPVGDQRDARVDPGLEQTPVAVYSGSLSTWCRGEATVAAGQAFERKSGGRFIILTREVELARRLCRPDGPEPVIRAVPFEEMPQWLSHGDVGLVLGRPGFANVARAPTKVGEYLASGLSVVVTAGVGDLDAQFEGSSVATTVGETADVEEIAEAMIEVASVEGRAKCARALAERYYSLDKGVDAYHELYGELGIAS